MKSRVLSRCVSHPRIYSTPRRVKDTLSSDKVQHQFWSLVLTFGFGSFSESDILTSTDYEIASSTVDLTVTLLHLQ